jgi:pyruvate formate lyase activating enzyme
MKLLAAARNMGIHTAMETNGYFGERVTDAELAAVDLVLLGIKTWTPERHKALTGMDIEPTLAFARRLANLNKPVWIRFVLVPGLTDALEIQHAIAEFAAGLGNVQRVEVLPFHQMGRFKWHKLGIPYTLENVGPPDIELVERACNAFRAAGLRAH